jgi:hypothetical protein
LYGVKYLYLCDILTEYEFGGMHTTFGACLDFVAYIDSGRRVVANEDDGEARFDPAL